MTRRRIHNYPATALLLLVLHFSCDAPRKNPLDVHNPNSDWAELSGTVTASGTPSNVVEQVMVVWNDDKIAVTDKDGRYALHQIQAKDGWLRCFCDGYENDSLFIAWGKRRKVVQDIQLTPLPRIQGYVKTTRVPPQPIVDVKVTWSAAQQFVLTDEQGFFQFSDISEADGQLFFEKEGYRSEIADVDWQQGPLITMDVFLNSNPTLDSLTLYSVVENNYGDRLVEQLNVFAYIDDNEGDINTVFLECSALDITAELSYNVQHKRFERSFSVSDLNVNSVRQLVGYDFHLMVLDDYDYLFNLGVERVERVIFDEIEIDSPKNSEQVSNFLTLQWLYFNPGFSFTYDIEIYTDDDFTQELVWKKESVPSDSLSTIVDVLLEPKEYVWMIWCVDEFSNRSRSKPGSFIVVE